MKKIIILSATVLFLMTACGTTKKAVTTTPGEDAEGFSAMSNEPCVELYEQSPRTRAYGQGQHYKEMTARNIAELQARAAYARTIESAVRSATDDIGLDLSQYAGDQNIGNSVTDQAGAAHSLVEEIAQQVVRNTHVIKTTRYYNKQNGQYKIYVCIEYNGDEDALVDMVGQKIENRISDADRTKIKNNYTEFRNQFFGDGKLQEN